MKLENSLRYVKLLPLQGALLTDIIPRVLPWAKSFLPLQGVWGKTSVINTKEIQVGFRKNFEQAPSTKQTSSKHQAARKRFVSMRSHTANRSSAAGEDL